MEHQQQHHHSLFPEVSVPHVHTQDTSRIWKTFWLLLVITLMELGLGLLIYAVPSMSETVKMFLKGVIVILTLAKAFYIIAIFMHLGDEIRNMIMTLAIPALLFVWFLGAFLWDGHSFKNLRNTHDAYHNEQQHVPAKAPAHHEEEGKKPGAVD